MKADVAMRAQAGIRGLKFLAQNSVSDAEIALANDKSVQIFVQKALVGASSTGDLPPQGTDPVAVNLAAALVAESLVPALVTAGASVQPVGSLVTGIAAVGASWVAEGQQTPVTRLNNQAAQRLQPRKISAIAVVSDEVARLTTAASNDALAQVLADSTALQLDKSMLDSGAATQARPQGLLVGATQAATNTIAGVLAEHAKKNALRGTVLVMDPTTATTFFEQLGDIGASLARLGVALHVTSADLNGQLVAINARRLVLSEPTTTSDSGKSASVEMVDAGDQNALAGSGATTLVNMFQTNSVALRAITWQDWHVLAPDAVTVGAAA